MRELMTPVREKVVEASRRRHSMRLDNEQITGRRFLERMGLMSIDAPRNPVWDLEVLSLMGTPGRARSTTAFPSDHDEPRRVATRTPWDAESPADPTPRLL